MQVVDIDTKREVGFTYMKDDASSISIAIVAFIVAGILFWLLLANIFENSDKALDKRITNFDECIADGNPVMESYPRQCRAEDKTFVENIGNELEKLDMIRINDPRPGQAISSPLLIEGEARGYWFFEGDFSVRLLDENGKLIGESVLSAQSQWMTEEFVPFEGELIFTTPFQRGLLILEKNNPSGLPENDDRLSVPVHLLEN